MRKGIVRIVPSGTMTICGCALKQKGLTMGLSSLARSLRTIHTAFPVPYALAAAALLLALDRPSSGQDVVRPSSQAPHVAPTKLFKSPKRTYAIRVVPKTIDSDAAEMAEAARAPAAPSATAAASDPDRFTGRDRKAAKLSIAAAPTETFSDLGDLIASLPPEAAMTHHVPPITTDPNSDRQPEEKRNVRVTSWLYAASKENDHDFHLILGREPGAVPERYMTMELSGLPPSGSPSFAKLKQARDNFKSFFGPANLPGTSYNFYDPPVPVIVEGSLFFDMTHATGGRPGPQSLRPHMPVIWEVHPITNIEFEPGP
jgi:muconolactone delta-isomerase